MIKGEGRDDYILVMFRIPRDLCPLIFSRLRPIKTLRKHNIIKTYTYLKIVGNITNLKTASYRVTTL